MGYWSILKLLRLLEKQAKKYWYLPLNLITTEKYLVANIILASLFANSRALPAPTPFKAPVDIGSYFLKVYFYFVFLQDKSKDRKF